MIYVWYHSDHYMKMLLKCLKNIFLNINHDSGHFRPANRPNFDLSKNHQKSEKSRFFQKFKISHRGGLWLIYVYMARKWPLEVPKHVFELPYTYICDLERFLKNRFFRIFWLQKNFFLTYICEKKCIKLIFSRVFDFLCGLGHQKSLNLHWLLLSRNSYVGPLPFVCTWLFSQNTIKSLIYILLN